MSPSGSLVPEQTSIKPQVSAANSGHKPASLQYAQYDELDDELDVTPCKTVTLGGANVKDSLSVLAAEQAAAEAELTRTSSVQHICIDA